MNLIGCVDSKREGPESVVVGSLEVVEEYFPRLAELVSLDIELVVEGLIEGDV